MVVLKELLVATVKEGLAACGEVVYYSVDDHCYEASVQGQREDRGYLNADPTWKPIEDLDWQHLGTLLNDLVTYHSFTPT